VQADLKMGESKEYTLKGPEGEHDVSISDGVETIKDKVSFAGNSITTNAIDVSEFKQKSSASFLPRFSLAWFFLIFVFIVFILLMIERVGKKKAFSYPVDKKDEIKSKKITAKDLISVGPDASNLKKAEYSLVIDGNREDSSLIGLKIKNMDKMGRFENQLFDKLEQSINDSKGLVYRKDNLIIGIFSSITTKSLKNELAAARTAKQMEKELNDYNRKSKTQIDYGLALNSGFIVLKKEGEIVKFTSMANTLQLTKKLSDMANKELLLSEDTYKRIMADVKAKRVVLDGLNVYKIDEIKAREEYKQFIDKFMQRQDSSKIATKSKPYWISQPKTQEQPSVQTDKNNLGEQKDNQKGFEFYK